MDSQRLILFFVFSLSVFLLLDAWQRDQRPPTTGGPEVRAGVPADKSGPPVPSEKLAVPESSKAGGKTPSPSVALPSGGQKIHVETDLLKVDISAQGGTISRLELKHHRDTVDKTKNLVLLQSTSDQTYIAQTGLIGNDLPNHRTIYTFTESEYRLADGADSVEVRLTAPVAANKVAVTKVLRFNRGSYVIDISYEISNGGETTLDTFSYFQVVRDDKAPAGDSAMLPTFTGAAVYTDKEKFQKVQFSDIEKGKAAHEKNSTDGWIALIQHYFFSAWLPKNGTPREFYTRLLDGGLYAVGVILPVGAIAPGKDIRVSVPFYAGPQEPEKLAKLAPGLDLTVDYGWLTIIAKPLFWLLALFHEWVGNWGVAIILLTIVIKLVFYPLSEASYKSMAKMRILAPKMQRLKEQYGDDRQRMQQAMMELYKTEKINPLGGCLPIVVQIPVFIALYWVLLASVELRHAPFMLWIDDLAAQDPWFVLPILMGISMIIQTRLNPEPPDPVQAKVMKIMPIAFSIFFFFFPAGLVLYWLVNNVLSIAQQWHINRKLERAGLASGRSRKT